MELAWLSQHPQALLLVTFLVVLYTGVESICIVTRNKSLIYLCSFSGIGLGKDNADILAEKVMANKKKRDNWINTRVLIIDESKSYLQDECLYLIHYLVSMVDGQLFDKIEYVARAVRQNSAPFGGLQVNIRFSFMSMSLYLLSF